MDVNVFIGIPFALGGRDFTGVDCYGLALLWNRHVLGKELPEVEPYGKLASDLAIIADRERSAPGWQRVTIPSPGDVVLLRVRGLPSHCGVFLGAGRFLHVTEGHHSCVEQVGDPTWASRVMGFYRHAGQSSDHGGQQGE